MKNGYVHHIGHSNLIALFVHREEGELFCRIFRDEMSNQHKAIFFFFTLWVGT
jgi:hypothetical protein